jgi:hypothetical protein
MVCGTMTSSVLVSAQDCFPDFPHQATVANFVGTEGDRLYAVQDFELHGAHSKSKYATCPSLQQAIEATCSRHLEHCTEMQTRDM